MDMLWSCRQKIENLWQPLSRFLLLSLILLLYPSATQAQKARFFAPRVKLLTAVNADSYDWSPDGKHLTYVASDGIWVVEAPNFRTPRRLIRKGYCGGGSCPGSEIRWSPDGRKIAFSDSRPGDGNTTIWAAHADGSHVRELLPSDAPFVYVGTRAVQINTWLGNRAIAFIQHCGSGCAALHEVKLDSAMPYRTFGMTQINVSNPREVYAWSPTGERAVVATPFGGLGLIKGKEANDLSEDVHSMVKGCIIPGKETFEGPLYQFDGWSPDGKRVLYTSWTCLGNPLIDSAAHLYLWDVDRNRQQLLVSNAGWATWSPDGTKIAFLLFGEPHYDEAHRIRATNFVIGKPVRISVAIMQVTNKSVRTLIPLGDRPLDRQEIQRLDLEDFRPLWSPNGQQLALSDINGNLFLVLADGSKRRTITRGGPIRVAWLPDGTQQEFRIPWEVTWSPDGQRLALMNKTSGTAWSDSPPGLGRFLPPVGKEEARLSDAEIIKHYFTKELNSQPPRGGFILYEYVQFLETYAGLLAQRGKEAASQAHLCQGIEEILNTKQWEQFWRGSSLESQIQDDYAACQRRQGKGGNKVEATAKSDPQRNEAERRTPESQVVEIHPWRTEGEGEIQYKRAPSKMGAPKQPQYLPSLYIIEVPAVGND